MMQFTACLLVQPSESEVRMVRSLCWVAPAEQTPRGWGSCAAAKLMWSCVPCIRCPMASSSTSCSSHPPPAFPVASPLSFSLLQPGGAVLVKGESWFLIPTCHIFSLHMGNVYPWAIHPLPKLGPELQSCWGDGENKHQWPGHPPCPTKHRRKKGRGKGKTPQSKVKITNHEVGCSAVL